MDLEEIDVQIENSSKNAFFGKGKQSGKPGGAGVVQQIDKSLEQQNYLVSPDNRNNAGEDHTEIKSQRSEDKGRKNSFEKENGKLDEEKKDEHVNSERPIMERRTDKGTFLNKLTYFRK